MEYYGESQLYIFATCDSKFSKGNWDMFAVCF